MLRPFRCLSAVTALVLLAGCGDSTGPAPGEPILALPRDLSVAEGKLIQADNRFALKLFREVNAQVGDSNIFVSPLSVAMALGMTYNGAAGATQQAMQETLELQGMTLDEVNHSYRDLIDLLRNLDPLVEFLIANSIWYRNTITFEQAFLDVNRQFFDAVIRPLDFNNPTAGQTINAWVSENTKGKIKEIVPVQIPADIIMYLINAIYFKGDWTYQFDKGLTAPGSFSLKGGSRVTAEMMWHDEPAGVGYFRGDGVTVLDLPYGGRAFSMTLLVPDDADGVGAVVGMLNNEAWTAWTAGLDSAGIVVSMPKFKLEYKSRLNSALKVLGMATAFCDVGPANFTKLRAVGDACVSYVDHKAYVDVNEEGTEAAAVTVVAIGETIAGGPPILIVDRPFVFVIREKFSGTILFMGKLMDPTVG